MTQNRVTSSREQVHLETDFLPSQTLCAAQFALHKPMVEYLDEAIKQVLRDKPKDEIKIMDAGAGTGNVGVELRKLGHTNLHALDISQEMLDEAKKKKMCIRRSSVLP